MEMSGIPTVSIIDLRARMEQLELPRSVVGKFPRGATAGEPKGIMQQRQVLLDALRLLETAREPGTMVDFPYRWRPEGG